MKYLDNDIASSINMIGVTKADIIIYLALPTEKFTVLLSYHRLAPIQIQFGIQPFMGIKFY